MGKLEVNIKHGGGDSKVLWVIVVVVAAIIIMGSGAAAIGSFLLTGLLIIAATIFGGLLIGGLAWFLTRGRRARATEAVERYRLDREETYHRRQLDMVRARAQIQAQESASAAMMISEAIKAGYQPQWPDVPAYQPTAFKAEVIKRDEDK